MAENSKIEWTHHTFNPWRGCTKISDGCKHCYAETLSKRNPATLGIWGDTGTRVVASDSYWKQPLKWNRDAEKTGERPRVFCASLADVFEDRLELVAPRQRLFELIDRTPNLDWLLLTKRPENIKRLWPFGWYDDQFTWANIWLGTTVENQEQADTRIPELLRVPAAVRFLSCEPLLEAVNLRLTVDFIGGSSAVKDIASDLHWVIVGGESGPGARPMHTKWARSLRDQCLAAGVPFFFKQWGDLYPSDQRSYANATLASVIEMVAPPFGELEPDHYQVGKKLAGNLLDGRQHLQIPGINFPKEMNL